MFSNTMFTGGGNIPQPEMTKINEVSKEFFDLLKKLSNDGTYNYRLIRLLKPMSICVLLADKEIHFVCSTEFSGVAREAFNNDHHLQEIHNDQVKTTVEGLGFTCLRADDIYETKPIIETIWENINKAKFIIADLTGKNPNVFYELGVAHTVGKDVILLSQNINDVPFDLRHLKVILYETTPRGVENLTKQLSATIQSITSRY